MQLLRSLPILALFAAIACNAAPTVRRRSTVTATSANDVIWVSAARNATPMFGLQSIDNPYKFILYFESSFLELMEDNNGTVANGTVILGPFSGVGALNIKLNGEEVQCIANESYCFLSKTIPIELFDKLCVVQFYALIYRELQISGQPCEPNDENCLTGATRPNCQVVMQNPVCSHSTNYRSCELPLKLDLILHPKNTSASDSPASSSVQPEQQTPSAEPAPDNTNTPSKDLLFLIAIPITGGIIVFVCKKLLNRPNKNAGGVGPITVTVQIGDPEFDFENDATPLLAMWKDVEQVPLLPQFSLGQVCLSVRRPNQNLAAQHR